MLNAIVWPEIAALAQKEIQKYSDGKSYCPCFTINRCPENMLKASFTADCQIYCNKWSQNTLLARDTITGLTLLHSECPKLLRRFGRSECNRVKGHAVWHITTEAMM